MIAWASTIRILPAFVVSTYGIWKAGGTVVPLNPMYRGELTHIFADSEIKGLVVSQAAYLDRVKDYAADLPLVVLNDDRNFQTEGPEAIFGMFAQMPRFADLPAEDGRFEFSAVVSDNLDTDFTPHSPEPSDLGLIAYTSGTSGRSKGAAATHANISSNSRYCLRNTDHEVGDGFVSLAPLFHITGFICQFLAAVAGGARLILNYRFDPRFVHRPVCSERSRRIWPVRPRSTRRCWRIRTSPRRSSRRSSG